MNSVPEEGPVRAACTFHSFRSGRARQFAGLSSRAPSQSFKLLRRRRLVRLEPRLFRAPLPALVQKQLTERLWSQTGYDPERIKL
jgi:hypothetical protein